MNKKSNDLLWNISLLVISVAAVIISGSNIIGIELPDIRLCEEKSVN